MEAVLEKKMTYTQFKNMEIPDGDTAIYELMNGNIVRRTSPNSTHQLVLIELACILGNFIHEKKLGRILSAPLDVIIDEKSAIQPDVFFVIQERLHIIDRGNGVTGSPDLIIEILSPSTAKYDRGIKKDLYEHFGVKEYWIADPANQTIEVYELKENRYKLMEVATAQQPLKSSVFQELELDLTEIFI